MFWRENNKHITQFTWCRKDRSEATRIDYFLIGPEGYKNSISCDIRPIVLQYTDHNCVSIKIDLNRGHKGRGYWKLNSSILENEDYVKTISNLKTNYKNKSINYPDLDLLWDNFKTEVRDISINYCKFKAKEKRDKINILEKDLQRLNIIADTENNITTKTSLLQTIEYTEEK